jgi:cell division protein FtsL
VTGARTSVRAARPDVDEYDLLAIEDAGPWTDGALALAVAPEPAPFARRGEREIARREIAVGERESDLAGIEAIEAIVIELPEEPPVIPDAPMRQSNASAHSVIEAPPETPGDAAPSNTRQSWHAQRIARARRNRAIHARDARIRRYELAVERAELRPARAKSRPDDTVELRVVDDGPRRRRRTVRVVMTLGVLATMAMVLMLVVFNVSLAQTQFEIEQLEARRAELERRNEDLSFEEATRRAPARIMEAAAELGLVHAGSAASAAPAPRAAPEGAGTAGGSIGEPATP